MLFFIYFMENRSSFKGMHAYPYPKTEPPPFPQCPIATTPMNIALIQKVLTLHTKRKGNQNFLKLLLKYIKQKKFYG